MENPNFADRHCGIVLHPEIDDLQLHRKHVVKVKRMAVNRRWTTSKLALTNVSDGAVVVLLRLSASIRQNTARCLKT